MTPPPMVRPEAAAPMAEEDAWVGADVELQVAHRGGVADDM